MTIFNGDIRDFSAVNSAKYGVVGFDCVTTAVKFTSERVCLVTNRRYIADIKILSELIATGKSLSASGDFFEI